MSINGNSKNYVSKWNGTTWSELGGTNNSTFNNTIYSIITDANGNVYAAGDFTNNNGKRYIAKWDGSTWSELGGINTSTLNNTIFTIASDLNGYIYSAGFFTDANGNPYVAEWNGTTWNKLGGSTNSIFNSVITSITTDAKGNIYAQCGEPVYNSSIKYYVAKWDGTEWNQLGGNGDSTFNNNIQSIVIDANNNIYAAGYFTNDSGYYFIAKYNITGLPIKIETITATQKDKEISLNWQTTNEQNTSYFIIQQSADGNSLVLRYS